MVFPFLCFPVLPSYYSSGDLGAQGTKSRICLIFQVNFDTFLNAAYYQRQK